MQDADLLGQINIILYFNSSPPSAAYMGQQAVSTFDKVMSCHLFGTKPLPELMLGYCLLGP